MVSIARFLKSLTFFRQFSGDYNNIIICRYNNYYQNIKLHYYIITDRYIILL